VSVTPWNTTVTTEVSSAAPTADPVWVDVSDWVLPNVSSAIGRQSVLPGTEPGRLALSLNNNSNEWTVGNAASSRYPWWKPGRRIRQRETLANGVVFDLFDGYITLDGINADVVLQTTGGDEGTMISVVRVSATDLLGRAQTGRTFVSTLGAQIMWAGESAGLVKYWPLAQRQAQNFIPAVGDVADVLSPQLLHSAGFGLAINDSADGQYITALSGPAILANDITTAQWLWDLNASGTAINGQILRATFGQTLTASTITIVAWIYRDDTRTVAGGGGGYPFLLAGTDPLSSTYGAIYLVETAADTWSVSLVAGSSGVTLSPRPLSRQAWNCIAVQMSLPSGACSVWMHWQDPVTGTLSGSPPSTADFSTLDLGTFFEGALGDVQIYTGAGYDTAFHRAQLNAASFALEGQSTGERVATIADYAGIPASQRAIDRGTVPMAPVSLAGRRAFDAWEQARETEQGRLFVSPSGVLTFHDRRTVFNV